jgi:hypothetical protein
MPPITLALLASVLHMQGVDATISSDNKGVDDLLMDIRGQLQCQVDPNSPRIVPAAAHHKTLFTKYYHKNFAKGIYNAPAPSNPGMKPAPGTHPPTGAGRRS